MSEKGSLPRRWLAAARRSAVRVRDVLDGLLHPIRRRRAQARITRATPSSLLFVCLGNVCRSPYAARIMADRIGPGPTIRSAGFIGPGRSPPERALEVARARGVDHGDHRSQTITEEMLRTADVVFVFDRFNVRDLRRSPGARMNSVVWLGDLDPEWTGKRAIIDPWGKASEMFDDTFARIERCIDAARAAVEASQPNGFPNH